MANEGHILIKSSESDKPKNSGRWGVRQFFTPVDKGSAKPAFCYPRRTQGLKEELAQMERNIRDGNVDPQQKMSYDLKAKKIRQRVGDIDQSFEKAKEIIDKAPDAWKTRLQTLSAEIAERTPSREDKRKRRVNPHGVLREEKVGSQGKRPLEEIKREYTVIARAFQARGDYEESNHSFLEKDN
jgi:hypothetical protein